MARALDSPSSMVNCEHGKRGAAQSQSHSHSHAIAGQAHGMYVLSASSDILKLIIRIIRALWGIR